MIEVRDLSFSYRKGTRVLDRVGLTIEKGSMHAIVGPNGSGKTTLLRAISGVIRPDSGSVTISGRPVREFTRKEMARMVSFLPQGSEYVFDFTVEEIVWMGRYPHSGFLDTGSSGRKAVERALDLTGTTAFRGRPYAELSGGEKQKVDLAKAIAQDPQVLILDEPTRDLDLRSSLDMLDLLVRLNMEMGLTVVAVIHDLPLVLRSFERMTMLKEGTVTASGRTGSVLTEDNVRDVFRVEVGIDKGAGSLLVRG